MSELNEYVVQLTGGESTVLLTDEEAESRGLTRAERKAARVENKAAAVENKAPEKRTAAQKRADIAARSFGGRKRDND